MAARLKPAGQNQREKDAVALGMIEAELDRISKGEVHCASCMKELGIKDLSVKLQAMKMRYEKLRPNLIATELTLIEPERSESDILQELQQLISANPDLIRSLLDAHEAAQAAQARLVEPVIDHSELVELDQPSTVESSDSEY